MIADRGAVRRELPSLEGVAYLNTGGAGPLPRAAVRAGHDALERSSSRGRMSLQVVAEVDAELAGLRTDLAELLASDAERIAVTVNTTHGVNAVVWGLDWVPGDRVVMTALEHPGMAAPVRVLSERMGVQVDLIPADEASEDLGGAVARRLTERTRLVASSHVAYSTGAVLDVAAAARAAREVGALTLVDGAQSVGAMPVAPEELGVDAYAFPSHKWLLGPEGLGGLWLSDEALGRVATTFASYESGTAHQPDGSFEPFPGARRLELSTPPLDLVPMWRASLAWLSGLGWERIHADTLEAARAARAALADVGADLVTPERAAGLVAFTIPGRDPERVCRSLAREGIVIRWIDDPYVFRLSAGFFTSDEDLSRLVTGLGSGAGRAARG